MTTRVPDNFYKRINTYVPAMAYAANVVHNNISTFSLGMPSASDANGILAGAVATDSAQTYTEADFTSAYDATAGLDSVYGRALRATGSSGSNHAITVTGRDYLGQVITELLTLSGTTVIYGKKAFKWVTDVAVAAGASGDTFALGWDNLLGLPYKVGEMRLIKENGVLLPVYPSTVTLRAEFDAAKAAAGGSVFLRSPVPGHVSAIRGIPHGGGSTNDPVVTVELGGTAITGLTVTVDTSDATGAVVLDVPSTDAYSENNQVAAGDVIEVVSAAAASAGAITVEVDVTNHQGLLPDTTDPATASTGDPRGTYLPAATPNGAIEFIVGYVADSSVNAAGNGGLYGIQGA